MDIEINTVSPFTNRPVRTFVKPEHPVFWCIICQKELQNVSIAFQHMTGRSHKAKGKARLLTDDDSGSSKKQKTNKTENIHNNKVEKAVVEVTVTKKSKGKEDEKHRCGDCDMEFSSAIIALDHFKGKKHAKKITANALAKQNSGRGTGRGRLRGNRGGRGMVNRRNFPPRDSRNYSGMQSDGQLMEISKNFFSHTSDNNMGGDSMVQTKSIYANSSYHGNNSYGYDNYYVGKLAMSSNDRYDFDRAAPVDINIRQGNHFVLPNGRQGRDY